MNPTAEQLDAVLEFLSRLDDATDYEVLKSGTKISDEVLPSICQIIEHDGYVVAKYVEESMNPIYIGTTRKGVKFITYMGGYTEIKRKEDLAHSVNQSVLDTNESVRKTNTLQKWLLIFATAFSLVTLVISYLDYKKDSVNNVSVPPPTIIVQQLQPSLPPDTTRQPLNN